MVEFNYSTKTSGNSTGNSTLNPVEFNRSRGMSPWGLIPFIHPEVHMQELMDFRQLAELLELDPRDEKRDRLVFAAACERICGYLDRNLITATKTETQECYDGIFTLREYPVREIVSLTDADTGETLVLIEGSSSFSLSVPGPFLQETFQLHDHRAERVEITYRSGYEQDEMPALIRQIACDMTKYRLTAIRDNAMKEYLEFEQSLLAQLDGFKRKGYP